MRNGIDVESRLLSNKTKIDAVSNNSKNIKSGIMRRAYDKKKETAKNESEVSIDVNDDTILGGIEPEEVSPMERLARINPNLKYEEAETIEEIINSNTISSQNSELEHKNNVDDITYNKPISDEIKYNSNTNKENIYAQECKTEEKGS